MALSGDELDTAYTVVKVVLIGDSAVGKTGLVRRYCDDTYEDRFVSTLGVDFKTKDVRREGKLMKLQIWDTAGQERFKALIGQYVRNAQAVLLCYDISRRESLQSIRSWVSLIGERQDLEKSVPIVLVGTKLDLAEKHRQVRHDHAVALANDLAVPHIETSAKDRKGVDEAFNRLVDMLAFGQLETQQRKSGLVVDLHAPEKPEKQTSWCQC